MNIYQRVILVLGAIVAVVAVKSVPLPWPRGDYGFVPAGRGLDLIAVQVTIVVRVAVVLAVTRVVWLALQGVPSDFVVIPARMRTRLRRLYLILWAGWLGFVLVSTPIKVVTDDPITGLLVLLGFPVALYVLMGAILAAARWAGQGVKEDEKKGGGKG